MSVSSDTQSVSQSPSPSPGTPTGITHAPKYGTVIPNRIFVGGIAPNTTEQELRHYFSAFGAVKDTKIIADRAGVSKGYGFVTFETQEDAEKIIKTEQSDNLVFKDRKLNIGPAIRKQQAFPRLYESTIPQAGTIMFQNGIPFTYQNGMAVFPTTEGAAVPAQPQQYLMTHQPQLYQPGHLQYYQPPVSAQHQWTTAAAPWRWAPQASPGTASPYGLYPTAQLQQLQGLQAPGELMYAQPPQYQPADVTEAAMMEAAPAEGSILHMEPPIHRTMYATDAQAPAYYKTPVAVTTTTPVRQQHHQQPQHCGHLSYSKQPPQLVRKTVNGTIINVLTSPERSDQMIITPLTPPPTPDSNQL